MYSFLFFFLVLCEYFLRISVNNITIYIFFPYGVRSMIRVTPNRTSYPIC